jgi:hypothetical protein
MIKERRMSLKKRILSNKTLMMNNPVYLMEMVLEEQT